jgi:integrase
MGKLTKRIIESSNAAAWLHDGHGLYLQVRGPDSKSWVFRYQKDGKPRHMGLGSLRYVPLDVARAKANGVRAEIGLTGADPMIAKQKAREQAHVATAKSITFKEAATKYIASQRHGWSNAKHAREWGNTLDTYAMPTLGPLPVGEINVGLVFRVLQPIWADKPTTASRLRGRIESVLGWAIAHGYRGNDNPARWDILEHMLPAPTKVRAKKHMAAMPYADVPAFMAQLREVDATTSYALAFLILNASRTGEVIKARWSEIDMDAATWTIPAERMKARKEHRIPLTDEAMAILHHMASVRCDEYVFAGRASGLSERAMLAVLQRAGHDGLTVHGFRSAFRDWAEERTSYPREVAEQALAHSIGTAVERAYRRTDLFEKRRQLMAAWATFCSSAPAQNDGNVVPIRQNA